MPKKRHTHAEKRAWVLARLNEEWERSKRTHNPPMRPYISGTDEEDQEAWEAAFGGSVKIYTLGPNVSPGFARTLRRMCRDGDLRRVIQGNQEARQYCQKTYHTSYTFAKWPLEEGD